MKKNLILIVLLSASIFLIGFGAGKLFEASKYNKYEVTASITMDAIKECVDEDDWRKEIYYKVSSNIHDLNLSGIEKMLYVSGYYADLSFYYHDAPYLISYLGGESNLDTCFMRFKK